MRQSVHNIITSFAIAFLIVMHFINVDEISDLQYELQECQESQTISFDYLDDKVIAIQDELSALDYQKTGGSRYDH